VDLITVAQALHWFDLDRFYAEVRRVARPNAIIAVWSYAWLSIASEIDVEIQRFYENVIGPFWPPERRYVEAGYATLPFPFRPRVTPSFVMEEKWTLDDFIGYLGTWSATVRCRNSTGIDPLPALR